jgi:enoyl-CoA hydratase
MGDIVVADRSARFGDPHVWNIGVTAGDGNAALLPLLIGVQQAKYYLLTGEFIPADEAHRLGLVTRLVDDSDLDSEVARIADRIASGPPLAIRSTKAAVQRYVDLIVRTVIPFSLAAEGLVSHSDDSAEARSAWAQRRMPVFTGLDARARGGAALPPGEIGR